MKKTSTVVVLVLSIFNAVVLPLLVSAVVVGCRRHRLQPKGIEVKVTEAHVERSISDRTSEDRRADAMHYPPLPEFHTQVAPSSNSCPRPVIVAVIDTGIDYTHPFLKEHLWQNPHSSKEALCDGNTCKRNEFPGDRIGWDFVHEVARPYDTHGHGTHISGIIEQYARFSAPPGCFPQVSIMALKYYDNNGAGYNNLTNTVRAIRYATEHGANIINYSGGGADPSDAERNALEKAGEAGILVVAAAGNDGHNNDSIPYFPGTYPLPNIIQVASLNKAEYILPSSNYGKKVHVAAVGLMVESSLPEGKWGTMSGTSQATAVVSGIAAMLMANEDPGTGYKSVRAYILQGADQHPLPATEHKTVQAGIVDAAQSLKIQSGVHKILNLIRPK